MTKNSPSWLVVFLAQVFVLAEILKKTKKKKLNKTERVGFFCVSTCSRILGHLAQFSRELYGTQPGPAHTSSSKKGHGFANKWTAPLVGMNVQHLKDMELEMCVDGVLMWLLDAIGGLR